MIIDFHTHIFPDAIAAKAVGSLKLKSHSVPFSDGTAEGLVRNMRRAGIDLSVILPVATSPKQVIHVNDASAALNEARAADGLFSFGCIHPDFEDYRAELARVKELGLRGIKIHPVYQNTDVDDPKFLRILDRAAELELIVVTHAGLDIGYPGVVRCSPRMMLHVREEIGSFRFVLAHMGGWRNWDEVAELLPETGFYLDTAFSTGAIHPLDDGHYAPEDLPMMNAAEFMKVANAFGTDRILFGTDSPWSDPEESIAFLRALPLPKAEIERILGGNGAELLRN